MPNTSQEHRRYTDTTQEVAVLDKRIEYLERNAERTTQAIQSIDETLKVFARVATQHEQISEQNREAFERAFRAIGEGAKEIKAQAERITKLEIEAPMNRMARKWIFTGVIGVVSLVGMELFSIIQINKEQQIERQVERMVDHTK
jgi:biopolymer transport protein ExbB/TolQ